MAIRSNFTTVLLAGMLSVVQCEAQTPPAPTPPCTISPQPVPCTAAPTTKPAGSDKFPFPEETGATTGSPQAEAPAARTNGDAPAAPKAKPTGNAFPFPEEDSKPAAGSSSSSSSSVGDTPVDPDATAAGLKDKGSEGTTPQGRRLLHRVNPIGTKLQTTEEREAEDLDVAHFYSQSGDLQGAYLRTQDAVKIAPDDADAHFALAEIARKLNKRDEAVAEYNACLKLDPIDKEAKAARKELERLKP